jgi:hypothetical protein
MVRIFSDHIRNRIRLEGFKSVHIWVRIFNIRYRIRIRILKSYIYDVDIETYFIRHDWHYPYSNPNPTRNMKTNMTSMISVRIRSVFIPTQEYQIVRPKWFLRLWCIRCKLCTYLALKLTMSTNGPKQDSIWHTSSRSSIGCVQIDF